MIIEAYADHRGTTVGVVKMLVLGEAGTGVALSRVLKKEEEIFQNSRKGRNTRNRERACAKAKGELVENIYNFWNETGLGISGEDQKISQRHQLGQEKVRRIHVS